jgi:hypothetical protein
MRDPTFGIEFPGKPLRHDVMVKPEYRSFETHPPNRLGCPRHLEPLQLDDIRAINGPAGIRIAKNA